jgi:hypothetical protein
MPAILALYTAKLGTTVFSIRNWYLYCISLWWRAGGLLSTGETSLQYANPNQDTFPGI